MPCPARSGCAESGSSRILRPWPGSAVAEESRYVRVSRSPGPQRPHSARGEPKSMCFPRQQGPTCSSHIALHWGQVPWPLPPHLTLIAAWQGRVNPHSHFTYENTEAPTNSMPSRGRNDSHNSCPLPRGSATWVHGGVIAPLEGEWV